MIPHSMTPAEGIAAPRTVRHVLAVGGGRGGVGKSTLAVNLAVYFAQLGRAVILVDADPSGAELHTHFGMSQEHFDSQPDDGSDIELRTVPTPVPGLSLMPQLYTAGSSTPVRPGRKALWAKRLRQQEADYVILDLGASTAPPTLDLFLAADIGLCVTSPDPPAVEATYRFARALFLRRLRRTLIKDRFKLRLVDRVLGELVPLPSPLDVVHALARYETSLAELAASELSQLRPRLVVNGIRLRHDNELGAAMCDMSRRYLGIELDHVGHIEQDDSVWLSVVRRRPILLDSPTSKSARNLERIARRVMALGATRDQARTVAPKPPIVAPEISFYDVLGTNRSSTDEEIRRAYKRQKDVYQPYSLALTSLLSDAELVQAATNIEEAYDTLLDPIRRRAYDMAHFPEAEEPEGGLATPEDSALAAERQLLRDELAREISAETEFTGVLLTKVRESLGIEIEEIARRTKIAASHLRAIEAEEYQALPALVYTRGFLQQVAKCLELDPTQVTRTYLRRMRGESRPIRGQYPS
jgi:flagellar biosynthesis protein FlhG